MPKLTIDGHEIEVPKGTRVIEAAKMVHKDIPYYCYHPGLSISGNCRMCLVEVEKAPKLQIACHLEAQDGMVVNTSSEKVLETRKHVLEFLLINHPVDCPVCDQAGECWLQDYYMRHGLYESRLNEDKLKKPKAVPIGPNVMLDAERCILCSRCIRFCDEVSGTNELGFIERGNHTEISVAPGRELDNKYSGNTVDICPVGALTDRDFRFKIRVWYLKEADSVCTGCSRGCNTQVHFNLDRPHHGKGERVKRLKPRYNEKINKWWMCDEGRYSYKSYDHDRLLEPVVEKTASSWDKALSDSAAKIKSAGSKFGVLVSPQFSNESLYLIKKLFVENLNVKDVVLFSPFEDGYQDDILMRADKNPNTQGATLLGFKGDDKAAAALVEKCAQGELDGLIVFGQDLLARLDAGKVKAAAEKLKWSLFIGPNKNLYSEEAGVVLPSARHIEEEGTFTNFEGIVQKFDKVVEPAGESRPAWSILISLAERLGAELSFESAQAIFEELAAKVKAFEGLTYENIDNEGSDIRTMAAPTIPSLQKYDDIL